MPIASGLTNGRVEANIDDERLPAGSYELRARATDAAGNERTVDRRPDGARMELTTHAAASGSWRYSYRFDGTRGRQVYRFRARVPRESVYPHETGASRHVTVTVRGI